MMKEFLLSALNYADEKRGINFKKVDEYIKMYSNDRRYKLFLLASTTSATSGIFTYRGIKYYFNKWNDKIELELMGRI